MKFTLLVRPDAQAGLIVAAEWYHALGFTDAGRYVTVVFTLRGRLVRVISARPMNRREQRIYEQA